VSKPKTSRLSSNGVHERTEENNPIDEKRLVFLSVEGKTEMQYFNRLNKHMKSRSNTVFEIAVLGRSSAGDSTLGQVIELLDEFKDVKVRGVLPAEWQGMLRLEERYSTSALKNLLAKDPSDKLTSEEAAICEALKAESIDLIYRKKLKELSRDDDIFAAVIDKDNNGRSVLEECIVKCEKNGYELYLTSPCFEFWLLLHLCDVRTVYKNGSVDLSVCKAVTLEVSNLVHERKKVSEKAFNTTYYPNIPNAIERSKGFATELNKIIDEPGTNLSELFISLGFKKEEG